MYRIKTEEFLLEMTPEKDNDWPENIINISMVSYDVRINTVMCTDAFNLGNFAIELKKLYTTLKGSASLHNSYGDDCFIEISALKNGSIKVEGSLSARFGTFELEHRVEFENIFDQTYMKDFVTNLFDDWT